MDATRFDRCAGTAHLVFAGLFFTCLAVFALVSFPRLEPGEVPTARKQARNRVYVTCGLVIVGCLVAGVLAGTVLGEGARQRWQPLFWCEAPAIFAFGVSWLVKGRTLLRDRRGPVPVPARRVPGPVGDGPAPRRPAERAVLDLDLGGGDRLGSRSPEEVGGAVRAVGLTSFGGPEVLELLDLPEPHAGTGQVRVAVRAAGVQHFDTGVRRGWSPPSVPLRFPVVPGNEFAGVVDEVGDDVTGVEVGDEVYGYTTLGCYAEHVVAPADQVVAKPRAMPWPVAGGFSANGQGAHLSLGELGIRPGEVVLVHAAAGALGTFAVQLARAWGAGAVIGTASEANHDHLRSIGAIPVAYGPGLVDRVRALGGVDAALDLVGGDALRASVELVEDRRRIRTMVDDETASELGVPLLTASRSATRLRELNELYERGLITIHLRHAYPLAAAADAHRDLETGHGRGKVVLTVP